MCIAAVIRNYNEKYPLIICHNRDEFHKREAEPLKQLECGVYAGIDFNSGGYWLSLTGNSIKPYFAAVLNYRNMSLKNEDKESRGILVKELSGLKVLEEAKEHYKKNYKRFSRHSIIICNEDDIFAFSSEDQKKLSRIEKEKEIVCFSNGLISESWPKQKRLEKLVTENVTRFENSHQNIANNLFEVLADQKKANLSELPNTFVGEPTEELLSSICIQSSAYGTRSSTVILWEKDKIHLYDRNFDYKRNLIDQSYSEIKKPA